MNPARTAARSAYLWVMQTEFCTATVQNRHACVCFAQAERSTFADNRFLPLFVPGYDTADIAGYAENSHMISSFLRDLC